MDDKRRFALCRIRTWKRGDDGPRPSQVNGASAAILTTTSDDAQLFVSGDRRLLVVPTPAN